MPEPDSRPTRLKRHAARWAVAAACFLAAAVPTLFKLDNGHDDWSATAAALLVVFLLFAFLSALDAFDFWSRALIRRNSDRTPRGFDVLPPR